MDFGSLGPREEAAKPIHPIEIFEKLPNLPGTPNDIWRGQTETLDQWHQNRTAHDVLVALNTGGGKTLVGLLIAQSLVNEGVDNVVYVCATIDLVRQTEREAEKIGLEHTIRVEGGYSNDLFESGRAFCITTYQAIFNALSSIRRNYFPGAVIFDDAHVAGVMLRDAYSLRVDSRGNADLFRDLCELFEPHFVELDQRGAFEDAIGLEHKRIVMAAPSGVRSRKDQLYELFERHGASDDNNLKYHYPHLMDRFDRCAVLFGLGRCEISPPFLPSLAIDVLERPIRRVYLSATLKYKTDFVRAFGRIPDHIIEPRNDAGNGERLILMERAVDGGFNTQLVGSIAGEKKVLIAVPNYSAAESWEDLGVPPDVAAFSVELNQFRIAENGVFLLVS